MYLTYLLGKNVAQHYIINSLSHVLPKNVKFLSFYNYKNLSFYFISFLKYLFFLNKKIYFILILIKLKQLIYFYQNFTQKDDSEDNL